MRSLDLIGDKAISGKIAKDLFEIVWTEGGDPRAIVEQRGVKQVTDLGAIEKVVDEIACQASGQGRRCQGQSEGGLTGLVGQVMKSSGGAPIRRPSISC